jgi:hypothetical protein
LNPDIPPKLEDVISKALEKDRNLRYQHASEMRTDLQRLKRDTESVRTAVLATEAEPVSASSAGAASPAFAGKAPAVSVVTAKPHAVKWPILAALQW